MTVAFVGYWLAPILIFARGLLSFAPQPLKARAKWWLIWISLAVGTAGFAVWLAALARGRGEFLPRSSSWVDYVLGTSGLTLYFATAGVIYAYYSLRKDIDIDLWFTRLAFLGWLGGLVLWTLETGLN